MATRSETSRHTALRTGLISTAAATIGVLLIGAICVTEIRYASSGARTGWAVSLGLALYLYALLVIGWSVRSVLGRRAARAAPETRHLLPLLGLSNNVRSTYVLLADPSLPPPAPEALSYERGRAELQRIMWDPAVERIRPGDEVSVRTCGWPGRRAVVDLADGTRLWPAGTLRHVPPRTWTLVERPSVLRMRQHELRARAVDGDLAATAELTALIRARDGLSETAPLDPLAPEHRPPADPITSRPELLLPAVVAAVVGVAGFTISGFAAAAVAAISVMGLAVYLWGWYGGDPLPAVRRPSRRR